MMIASIDETGPTGSLVTDDLSAFACAHGAPLELVELLADCGGRGGLEHCATVSRGSRRVGRELGMTSAELDQLALAGLLHDVGKCQISGEILDKPGPLDAGQWAEIRRHPEIGAELVAAHGQPQIAPWVLAHHERVDGRGYPRGLRGEEIPLQARILAVIDAYDAMTSDRPYRDACLEQDAVNELIGCAESQLDPTVVKVFCRLGARATFEPLDLGDPREDGPISQIAHVTCEIGR